MAVSNTLHAYALSVAIAATMVLVALPVNAPRASIRNAEDMMIVDCLLPGTVRKLGKMSTYMSARRPIRTIQSDCEIRGGEYVAYDRANYETALKVWMAQAESGDAEAQNYVGEIYDKGLGIAPDQENDFDVRSQTEMLETMSQITGTFTALLGSVAAVSLFVGGIGIMNIMLVSVRERTREIGVRMAVGARRRDILMQFLVEAVVVSLAGGALGVALGFAAANLLARFGQWQTVVPTYAVVLALTVSIAIGIVFGVGPARRAARLDPVEALRFE